MRARGAQLPPKGANGPAPEPSERQFALRGAGLVLLFEHGPRNRARGWLPPSAHPSADMCPNAIRGNALIEVGLANIELN